MRQKITKVLFQVLSILFVTNTFADSGLKYPDDFKPKFNTGISFTENKGQVHDQNNHLRPDVLFGGTDGNLVFHLKKDGISYQLRKVNSWKQENAVFGDNKKCVINNVPDQSLIYRLDVNWLNSVINPVIIKSEVLEGVNNYYLENCSNGALNAVSYEEIIYKNIYAGIDLKWYQKDGHLKYDYLVAAGADYTRIQLEIKGAEKISLNFKGELILKTPLGDIIEQAPLVNQNGKILKSTWVIKNNILSFDIENIDPNHSFIIDPVVRNWGTYYGASAEDRGISCATDANGNVFLAGYTASNTGTVIATAGSHQTTFSGGTYDAFLAKFNSNGVRQWATYYGGSGYEQGFSCATTTGGDVYLSGQTDSNTGIATVGSHQSTFGGGTNDGFLVKFNSGGVRQWATYYGGGGNEFAYCCATDASGNVYMTGQTSSGGGIVIATAGSHQSAFGGGSFDGFLVKFNSSGVRQWGTYYGGTGNDIAYSSATDNVGNVYLSGWTNSGTGTIIATPGSHQSVFAGTVDAFLIKFNSGGVRQWGTYYGGANDDRGYSIRADALANIYITGYTDSNVGSTIATVGSHQSNFGGGPDDVFLVKFNSGGIRQWGTYYGGSGFDEGMACATDASGNVYITGQTSTSTGTIIATAGSHQSSYGGGFASGFLIKFNSNGLRQWGTYYGGSVGDYGNTCSTDAIGNVYLAGFALSNTGTVIATVGSHQPIFGGGGSLDAFLVQFFDCTPAAPTNTTPISNQSSCANNTTTLYAIGSGTISWFASPSSTTVLGTGTAYITPTLSVGTYTYYAEALTCVISDTRTAITVTVNPNPTITVNSGSICSGNSFTIIPSGANSYTFQGGNAVVSPTTSSNYTVTGTSTAGCVSQSLATANITVSASPTITVNNGSICSGNNFTMIPSGANTYTFQGGNAIVSPTINASYTVSGTSTAGCVSQSFATSNVTVNANPTITVNSGSICSGNNFTMIPSGANTYTFQGGNAIVSPTINTSYTVAGTNTAGCISQTFAVSDVTVFALPVITVNSGSICSGNNFTMIPSGANSYTFTGGGPVVTPSVNTSYSVIGTNTAGCTNTIAAVSDITVNALPTVSATSNLSLICVGESATLAANGANTYSWNTGGTNSNEVVSPTITTTYTVNGTDANGCSNTAIITQSVDLCTGLAKQNFTDAQIQIYPNPNNGEFTLKGREIETFTLINALGQVISTIELNKNNNYIANINNLPAGIYFICCKTAKFKMIVLE